MSDSYTKGIPISLTINEKDLKEFKEIVDKIEKGQEADLERLKEIVKTGGTGGQGETPTSETVDGESAVGGTWWITAIKLFSKVATKTVNEIKKISAKFLKEFQKVQDLVDYSRLSNQAVREQAFEFGFSPAENYAYTQAMDVMGLSSFEDLYFLTEKQWTRFNNNFEKFQERYTKLYDEGFFDAVEDFNYQMAEWEEDLKYTFLQFVVDNKEDVMDLLDLVENILETTVKMTSWFFGESAGAKRRRRASEVAEIVGTGNSTTTKNTTVTFSPVFNGVGSETKASLDTSLSLVKEQILLALE